MCRHAHAHSLHEREGGSVPCSFTEPSPSVQFDTVTKGRRSIGSTLAAHRGTSRAALGAVLAEFRVQSFQCAALLYTSSSVPLRTDVQGRKESADAGLA